MVLRWRDGMSGLSGTRQRGEGEGLVAVAFLNAEEPDALDGEQLVHRRLNVGAHVPGKLPRRCDQPIPRDTGEMPFNRGTGKVEPLCSVMAPSFSAVASIQSSQTSAALPTKRSGSSENSPHSLQRSLPMSSLAWAVIAS